MALRSVLGKMGSSMTMTSSKCIHNNARLVLMLRNFDKHKIHDHSDNNKDVVSMSAANAYLFELGCYDANGVRIPMTVNRVRIYDFETRVVAVVDTNLHPYAVPFSITLFF